MSLRLHLSARSDELLAALCPRLAAARVAVLAHRSGVPPPVPVLVPSPQLSDWLQVRLARDLGLCMGFEFLSPGAYFSRHFAADPLADAFADAHAAWSPDRLRWRLLPHVDGAARHLGQPPGRPLGSRDRFAFAQVLARQFDRYARHRPDWPERWDRGLPVLPDQAEASSDHARADEAWQRDLWRKLAAEPNASPHPARLLGELARAESSVSDRALPLFVLASGPVDPLLLRTLQVLDRRGHDVALFLLLPSLGFLGDLSRRELARRLLATGSGNPPDDPAAQLPDGHPLLASLGQQAVGTFKLLEEISPDYAEWPTDPSAGPATPDEPSLLRRLQADIRAQRPPPGLPSAPTAPDPRPAWSPADRSLQVHCCHSPRRELELLRDELRRAFTDLPGLQPDEVLIAVADFDRYAPLADGILRAGSEPLPVRLTSLPAREANPIAVALLALLRLAAGRRTASELIDLLTLTAVQHRLEVAGEAETVAQLAETLRQSGLTHGLDARDRPEGEATGTWRTALDRHLAGVWFGPEPGARDAAGELVHPLAGDLHHHDDAIRRLHAWLVALAGHLRAWESEAPASAWAERLGHAVTDLLACAALDDHAAALRRRLGELAAVPADTPLDTGALVDWLESQLENATSLRTTMGGEILLGRTDQIHGLPCRVLAILGLEDGAFPRAPHRPAWDLLSPDPKPWDPDLRRQDRQWFLDSVLAPTDRLILCAANRSLRTPHDGPLSSCVEELLRAARETLRFPTPDGSGASPLVVNHRLQPFAADYFRPGSPVPRSFDAAAARIAGDLAGAGGGLPPPFYTPGPATAAGPAAVTLDDLIRFWRDPARAWLRALQIEIPGEEADDAALDDPPVNLDALGVHAVRRAALGTRLPAAPTPAVIARARLAADRALPPGPLGALVWERCEREVTPLADALAGLLRHAATVPIDCALPALPRLTGEVLCIDQDPEGTRVLVYRPGPYDRRPGHQFEALLRTLATAAQLDRPVGAIALGLDDAGPRALPAVPPAPARALLAVLGAGYAIGQQRPLCFAPEASDALAAAFAKSGDAATALDRAREVWEREPFGPQPAGEGLAPAALLVWRDTEPFAPPHDTEWLHWADAVARPLRAWWNGDPLPEPDARPDTVFAAPAAPVDGPAPAPTATPRAARQPASARRRR